MSDAGRGHQTGVRGRRDSGGVGAWMAKLDVNPDGGIAFDERFFPAGEAFRGRRVHQVRLQGGDASNDSYCFPS